MSNSLTRYETFLTSIANGEAPKLVPITRKEMFLAKASGVDVGDITPITREEMFLNKISSGGGELEINIEGEPTFVGSNATKIPDYALMNLKTLVRVDFPDATSIGKSAFENCNNLNTVHLPNATSIGKEAFSNCNAIDTVNFPSATHIGDKAFYVCQALTGGDFPNVISVGQEAFVLCKKLYYLDFSNVTSIDENAFIDTSLTILLLRNLTMCDIAISALGNTKIINIQGAPTGEGFVYVPTALYEAYIADLIPKAIVFAEMAGTPIDEATATYIATAILRKLEDYTVDGTTTGMLDESKIQLTLTQK